MTVEELLANGRIEQIALVNVSLAALTPGQDLPPDAPAQVALVLTGTPAWAPDRPRHYMTTLNPELAAQFAGGLADAAREATAPMRRAKGHGLVAATPADVAGVAAAAERFRGTPS